VAVEQEFIVKRPGAANSSDNCQLMARSRPEIEVQLTLERLSKIVGFLASLFEAF
jgi:hypothetical protein